VTAGRNDLFGPVLRPLFYDIVHRNIGRDARAAALLFVVQSLFRALMRRSCFGRSGVFAFCVCILCLHSVFAFGVYISGCLGRGLQRDVLG